jgi:hypothetical protein
VVACHWSYAVHLGLREVVLLCLDFGGIISHPTIDSSLFALLSLDLIVPLSPAQTRPELSALPLLVVQGLWAYWIM